MELVNKYYCLGFREFQVLLSTFQLKELPCFETEEAFDSENIQSEYNTGVFELYKKGIILQTEEGMKIEDEVCGIFAILKNAKKYVIISSKSDEVSEYILYFGNKKSFIVASPGRHKNEYIKLQKYSLNQMSVFLEECGALPEKILSDEMLQKQEMLPVKEDIEKFIKKETMPEPDELNALEDLEVIFSIIDIKKDQCEGLIGILKQPLQDKILVCKEKERTLHIYSDKNMIDFMTSMIEEKQ